MTPAREEQLRAAPLTYAEVGATATGLPDGYRPLQRSRPLEVRFEDAAERLMTWDVHRRAGLSVDPSGPRVTPDAVVEMRLLGLRIPCRVVYVVDEPGRIGFAYGTLSGHPESGEERFVVERHGDRATFAISVFSRPATTLARLSGPAARRAQDLMTRRYLRAIG